MWVLEYLIKKPPLTMKPATISLIKVKSCNTFLCMLLLCIRTYPIHVVIFWCQKGAVSKNVWETLPQTIHNWSSIQWVTKEQLFPYGPGWTHLHFNRITNSSLKCLHYYFQIARCSKYKVSLTGITCSRTLNTMCRYASLFHEKILYKKKNCTFISMGHTTRSHKNK